MGNVDVSSDFDIKNNKKCIASLILGILSIITSIVAIGLIFGIIGLIFGVLGLKEVNRFKQKGKRKAIAGIICCLLGIILTFISSVMAGIAVFS